MRARGALNSERVAVADKRTCSVFMISCGLQGLTLDSRIRVAALAVTLARWVCPKETLTRLDAAAERASSVLVVME